MLRTIILLIIALIVLPLSAIYIDNPLGDYREECLYQVFLGMACTAFVCFVVGELTGNCSQVDKLWSIVPAFYAWFFAYKDDFGPRTILMACLVTLWAVRLTYNFARRGGYQLKFWGGEEDYRWEVLRKMELFNKPWKWTLFNFGFICGYQMTLILLFTVPMVHAVGSDVALGWADYLLAAIIIGLVIIETIADQQQWNYQTEKHRRMKAGEPLTAPYDKGFTHTGLWGIVRHPNYAAEQSIWFVFYFFSVVSTGIWLNWTAVGAILLLILFKGSADFSEGISLTKYKGYADYVKKVPRFLPF
jgi:steroid 5-alpha reductase family enzyme